ncbi:MAG: MBL fold metallo-hydrolase [Deltaproteobacteria bacterium]|nr:MBL fold metallo-hydrolase [Deltaproteobacteria bacterium]MBW1922825.1 MBL fold metallo-hydrolase [Deltaproteobacteria bacterium]MBW1948216.1 MBL fold metallo-hydrolase [Deltaproteobacteria bacterium]MBW2006562.1 MBL fold metallo-hydrolase [Deltaproteobacteria bacterium]MBW2101338.1 MBL fold metallo-hydrolase [Deltaproteobacteria bacterium]
MPHVKIADGVFQVGGGSLTSPEDAAIYLVRSGAQAALVDAGCGGAVERLMENIRSCGIAPDLIELILLTHCHFDHVGGAADLKERVSCAVAAHELEAPYLERGDNLVTAAKWYGSSLTPFTVEKKIAGAGENIQIGDQIIQAIHVPGHSPGSMVFLMVSDGMKILFAQDVHGPLHPDLLSDRKAYLESLDRLLSLEADILCEGHFGIYRGRDEVSRFIRSFMP